MINLLFRLFYFILDVDIIVKISAFRGNIHFPWILSAFRGNIHIPLILSPFRGYIHTAWILSEFIGYIHILWILSAFVDISAFFGYYPHSVGTIHIGHITSYLYRNVCHVIHSFVLVVDIIFGQIRSSLARNVHPISHILLI